VLWAGDMNFRVDMSYQEVLEHCKERRFYEILLKDEFRMKQTKHGKSNFLKIFFHRLFYIEDAYADFKEADIDFAPTYKFDLHYNDDIYAKHRTPSYTVRITIENRTKFSIKKENNQHGIRKEIDIKLLFMIYFLQ